MTDKQIKKITGFKVDKATEDELMDFSRYELVDIILAYREEYNELTRVHTKLNEKLKRKEQECEELNEHSVGFARKCQNLELDVFHLKDKNYNLQRQLDQLKAENDELKRQHQGDKGLITSTGKMNYQLLQEYDQLKAENDELKEEIDDLKEIIQRHDNDNNALLSEFEDDLVEYYRKYKECLTEIKEIASKVLLNTHDLEQFKDADALFGALLEIHKKISEVENGV